MATGLLVDHERIRSSSAAVGWVDPSFSVGRLARYGLVPSNTSLEGTSISRRVVASLNCAYWPWRTPLRPLALPHAGYYSVFIVCSHRSSSACEMLGSVRCAASFAGRMGPYRVGGST